MTTPEQSKHPDLNEMDQVERDLLAENLRKAQVLSGRKKANGSVSAAAAPVNPDAPKPPEPNPVAIKTEKEKVEELGQLNEQLAQKQDHLKKAPESIVSGDSRDRKKGKLAKEIEGLKQKIAQLEGGTIPAPVATEPAPIGRNPKQEKSDDFGDGILDKKPETQESKLRERPSATLEIDDEARSSATMELANQDATDLRRAREQLAQAEAKAEEEKSGFPERTKLLDTIMEMREGADWKEELAAFFKRLGGMKTYRFDKDGNREYLVLNAKSVKFKIDNNLKEKELVFDVFSGTGEPIGQETQTIGDIEYREFKKIKKEEELPVNGDRNHYRAKNGEDVVALFSKDVHDRYIADYEIKNFPNQDWINKAEFRRYEDKDGKVIYTKACEPLKVKGKKDRVPLEGELDLTEKTSETHEKNKKEWEQTIALACDNADKSKSIDATAILDGKNRYFIKRNDVWEEVGEDEQWDYAMAYYAKNSWDSEKVGHGSITRDDGTIRYCVKNGNKWEWVDIKIYDAKKFEDFCAIWDKKGLTAGTIKLDGKQHFFKKENGKWVEDLKAEQEQPERNAALGRLIVACERYILEFEATANNGAVGKFREIAKIYVDVKGRLTLKEGIDIKAYEKKQEEILLSWAQHFRGKSSLKKNDGLPKGSDGGGVVEVGSSTLEKAEENLEFKTGQKLTLKKEFLGDDSFIGKENLQVVGVESGGRRLILRTWDGRRLGGRTVFIKKHYDVVLGAEAGDETLVDEEREAIKIDKVGGPEVSAGDEREAKDAKGRVLEKFEKKMAGKNYYEILGVPKRLLDDGYSEKYLQQELTREFELKKVAYQYLVKEGKITPEAEEAFLKIEEIYDVLSDPHKRAEYNKSIENTEEGIETGGKYKYEAMDTTGGEVTGTVDAGSEVEAQAKIRGMGYFVTKLTLNERRGKGWLGRMWGKLNRVVVYGYGKAKKVGNKTVELAEDIDEVVKENILGEHGKTYVIEKVIAAKESLVKKLEPDVLALKASLNKAEKKELIGRNYRDAKVVYEKKLAELKQLQKDIKRMKREVVRAHEEGTDPQFLGGGEDEGVENKDSVGDEVEPKTDVKKAKAEQGEKKEYGFRVGQRLKIKEEFKNESWLWGEDIVILELMGVHVMAKRLKNGKAVGYPKAFLLEWLDEHYELVPESGLAEDQEGLVLPKDDPFDLELKSEGESEDLVLDDEKSWELESETEKYELKVGMRFKARPESLGASVNSALKEIVIAKIDGNKVTVQQFKNGAPVGEKIPFYRDFFEQHFEPAVESGLTEEPSEDLYLDDDEIMDTRESELLKEQIDNAKNFKELYEFLLKNKHEDLNIVKDKLILVRDEIMFLVQRGKKSVGARNVGLGRRKRYRTFSSDVKNLKRQLMSKEAGLLDEKVKGKLSNLLSGVVREIETREAPGMGVTGFLNNARGVWQKDVLNYLGEVIIVDLPNIE